MYKHHSLQLNLLKMLSDLTYSWLTWYELAKDREPGRASKTCRLGEGRPIASVLFFLGEHTIHVAWNYKEPQENAV